MKIALCFSGQPRTWDKCQPQWEKFKQRLATHFKADIDVFAHIWDFNTPPHAVMSSPIVNNNDKKFDYRRVCGVPIGEEEKNNLLTALNPTRYIIENERVSRTKPEEVFELNRLNLNEYGESPIEWSGSQFYAVMYAAHLKKSYEFEQGIRYDMCFRIRYDLYLNDHQIDWFFNAANTDARLPRYNTVYSCHSTKDASSIPFHRLGDIFWYADSPTFDRICDFYRWLPILGRRCFNNEMTSTEHALYFYAKMLRMHVKGLSIDPKVYRQSDYIERKLQSGLSGKLGGHELI
jgi:hypothetical protein